MNPTDGAVNIPVGSTVTITFSQAVAVGSVAQNAATGACLGNIQISSDSFATCIGVTPVWDGPQLQLTLTPVAALSYNTLYQVKVLTTVQSTTAAPLAAAFNAAGFNTESPPALNVVSICSTGPLVSRSAQPRR